MRLLKADLSPAFGHKFIDALTAADIREVTLAIERRDARDVAKRVNESTAQIFRYAIARGIAEQNPARDLKPGDILAAVRSKNFARVDAGELPELLAETRQMVAQQKDKKTEYILAKTEYLLS